MLVTLEDLCMKKKISMKLDFPVLFKKNNEKLNKKEVFSAESKEQHQNSKRTEILRI